MATSVNRNVATLATDGPMPLWQHVQMPFYIREWREFRRLSQEELGNILGITKGAVSKWEKGKRRIGGNTLVSLANAFSCLISELEQLPPKDGITQREKNSTKERAWDVAALSDGLDGVDFRGEPYVAIGVFDAHVSAGPGAVGYDAPPERWNLFRLDWLRSVTGAPPGQLAVIRVSGDSMQSTLHNGDHVLVDRAVKRVGRDAIYIYRQPGEDELQVKRIMRDPRTGLLTIRSDNPAYDPWIGVRDDQIEILGRVIWLGRNVGG